MPWEYKSIGMILSVVVPRPAYQILERFPLMPGQGLSTKSVRFIPPDSPNLKETRPDIHSHYEQTAAWLRISVVS
jgi:hypothetical protein